MIRESVAAGLMLVGGMGAAHYGSDIPEDLKQLPGQYLEVGKSAIGSSIGIGETKELAPPMSPDSNEHLKNVYILGKESVFQSLPLKTSNDMVRAGEFAGLSLLSGGALTAFVAIGFMTPGIPRRRRR